MAKSGIFFYDKTLFKNVERLPDQTRTRIQQTVDYFTPRVQSYARENAPWTDQTGNARQGLTAVAEHGAGNHAIVISHGVPYGIWLEVRFEGRYAIITPTIKAMGAELMKLLRALFSGTGR